MSQVAELVVIIRPSFKKFCAGDSCRAALYNHLLYRLAKKAKGASAEAVQRGDIFWYGSAEDICEDMDDAWCVNKIRKEINFLVSTGILGQRRNPNNGWDQRRHYYMSEVQGARLLYMCHMVGICLRHIGLTPDVLHLLNMVNGLEKEGNCNCQICEMHLPNIVNASTINGNAITKGTTKGSSEGTNQDKERDAPTHSSENAIASQTPSLDLISSCSLLDEDIDAIMASVFPVVPRSERTITMNVTRAGRGEPFPVPDEVIPPAPPQEAPTVTTEPIQDVRIADEHAPTDTSKQDEKTVEQPPLLIVPLSEPAMNETWSAETCVQYVEWKNKKRYDDLKRLKQLESARTARRIDPTLTLARFQLAYDDWFVWWKDKKKGSLHVSDMNVKQQNTFTRLENALNRIDDEAERQEKRKNFSVINGTKPQEPSRRSNVPSLAELQKSKVGI